ncbi:MAG TPA: phosphate ABC transporter substrate-binding protein [Verrucomicrobiales bacterium]|jgi:phosphate transport system substrate-binding protein|nr:phosphate ABC transporter substrate-binding protein [Verrucomicrobiales bacterium]
MKRLIFTAALAAFVTGLSSCGDKQKTLKVSGSNTMAQVATSWAENFKKAKVSVAGGGSGIGINDLTEGKIDICTSSRPMKQEEKDKVKAQQGKEPKEFVVGYDALAVFVNPANPIKEISMEQLKEIYLADGSITKWEQLGPGGATGNIEVLGREQTSGTYEFIHDVVLGKDKDGNKNKFRTTVAPQSSSQAIIDNLANMKGSIGYDGMAFNDPKKVKWIGVSKKTGEPSVMPGVDDARSGKYPLARKLYLYTVGEPEGAVKEFIDFALSAEGQKLLSDVGYVSLK